MVNVKTRNTPKILKPTTYRSATEDRLRFEYVLFMYFFFARVRIRLDVNIQVEPDRWRESRDALVNSC